MSRDIAPFGVRMPAELKEYLTQKAKENKRSLNAEIVERLEMTEFQDYQHSNGFYFLIQDFKELEKECERLQDEIGEYSNDIQSVNLKVSIDELRDKIDALMKKSNH
ncbi:Arc family DNA-binding protein [Moraxella bovis]|uniref:Arc-like DNA binding domain n=1 Tax=Moraxella bovis TaxID=476 RepID=A0A378PYX9_MORBO|nr:Arc family DNA-binding protein [Moraxella bovis]STY93394.1 Arc-like DNA binding domain [Moraxella bovis]